MNDQSRPNVVFILADNIGWGDFGVYGGLTARRASTRWPLPASASTTSTWRLNAPPRARRSWPAVGATGCYTVPLDPHLPYGLAPREYTIAELFSDAGYATAQYGKWHLGAVEGRLPTKFTGDF